MENIVRTTRNGWEYTIWCDENWKITHIQCAKRYPKTDARFIGDNWIVADLQSYIDSEMAD